MDKQAKICETYQLKWSSFSSYMHSCISTSLQTDSFADVALVTTDGHQIMAHRYILSYSSLFLAQILNLQKKVTTALPLMIVLPPEIDNKTLKVLVRYMYSGEAKVSKEILQSVLKGGDLLQIKGLYREAEDNDKNAKLTNTNKPQVITQQQTVPTERPSSVEIPLTSANNNLSTVTSTTAKQTPKIIKKPVAATTSTPIVKSQDAKQKVIYVQKPKSTYSSQKQKVLNFTMMQSFEKIDENVTILNKSLDQSKEGGDKNEQGVGGKSEPKETNNLQYLMIKDEPIDWNDEIDIIDTKHEFDQSNIKSEDDEEDEDDNADETNGSESNEPVLFNPLTCELCTETFKIPKEWVRHVQTHTDMLPAKRRRRDSTGDSYENDTFPELMCDLCQKSFPTPGEWVRHVHTHTEFELHLSNKKHATKGKANFPSASSSSSSSSSPKETTAATTTTKTATFTSNITTRAATSNKSTRAASASKAATTGVGVFNKCPDCEKTFSSYASMLVHRRKHTGEQPFSCQFCPKMFNVKSNLLRHLRTLHNTILTPKDIKSNDIPVEPVNETV